MPQLTPATGARGRRRGEVLERALYEATLAELADVGYGGLTMEGIAARAHTGKAALYRRWGCKNDLVHAALVYALPSLPESRPGRSARDNLLAVFTAHRDVLAGKTGFPGLHIIGQLIHEPELRAIFADAVVGPRLVLVESILRTAVEEGDLDPATITPFTARIGPALINHQCLVASPPTRRELGLIVDTVIPPRPPARAGDRAGQACEQAQEVTARSSPIGRRRRRYPPEPLPKG